MVRLSLSYHACNYHRASTSQKGIIHVSDPIFGIYKEGNQKNRALSRKRRTSIVMILVLALMVVSAQVKPIIKS